MKVFIAGATGVLGRRVVPALTGHGHHVVGLCRSQVNRAALERMGAEPRFGDMFDGKEIQKVSAGCDAILHLATSIPNVPRPSAKHWRMNDRIRVEGTTHLVDAAVRNDCRLYLQQSVTLLYGDRTGAWVDESAEIPDRQPKILRSASRMEEIVRDRASREGLPAVILRFGSFYAHDSAQTISMFRGMENGRLPVIGNGGAFWNMVHVDDAAVAIVRSLASAGSHRGTVLNVCDDEPVQCRDLFNFIADTMGVKRPGKIPGTLARLAIGGDLVTVLLSSVRVRNGKAGREIGWRPAFPTYREGFRQALRLWSESRESGGQ